MGLTVVLVTCEDYKIMPAKQVSPFLLKTSKNKYTQGIKHTHSEMRKSKKKSFESQPFLGNRRQFNTQRDSLKVQRGLEECLIKKKKKNVEMVFQEV